MTIKIPPQLEQEIALASERERLSMAALVRRALVAYISQRNAAVPGLSALEQASDLVGVVKVAMSLADEVTAVRALLERCDNVPASLADACLVRMSELYEPCRVITLDCDFHTYRRHGRKVIPVLTPRP
ncbi:hypothetical protein [Polaromonas sp. CG_23.6]|uniref:hypothetical protein n=1 Tax=Polaromonas sp. CG_23.6 TaxID=2760709 RepID=UPI002477184C|nr:hypothetical protein [Polaromonas sp. CG_23.6]MDH6185984.1 putative nucleic acid-binding protein [Polaromonas sp. CG_23.6]